MRLRIDRPTEDEFNWSIDIVDHQGAPALSDDLNDALATCDGGAVQLWLHDIDPSSHQVAEAAGFVAYRDLWQLRRPLPAGPSEIITRGFLPHDMEEFVAVNNRAFSWHPEQGGLTAAAFRTNMTEKWFESDGVRLLHVNGRLAGFCWTKIHAETRPRLGEIYAIALDPDFHGQGLGAPMTLAGLEWLSDQGLVVGMLYVESDNEPANAVYSRLGFTLHHTDRAYRLTRT